MEYYLQVKNGKIISNSNFPVKEKDVYNLEINQTTYIAYQNTPERFYVEDDKVIMMDDTQWEEYLKQKEKERISHLKCTKRVLVIILEQLGKDYFKDIQPLINNNRQAKLEWELCVELERSNPLLDIIGAQLNISPEQIDEIFKYANRETQSLEVV